MTIPQDQIYVVPVFDQWLLYAPLHSVLAIVNKAAVVALKKETSRHHTQDIDELIGLLNKKPVGEPRPNKGSIKPEFLGIIPTRACNFNCVYCGFDADSAIDAKMDYSLAVSAIDWMVDKSVATGRKSVSFHFFGGEPFHAPDVVELAVHRSRAQAAEAGLVSIFETATNGFFSEERCRFIGDYFNTVVLSFDGPEDIQNRYRPMKGGKKSFPTVARNARMLSTSSAKLCIRICVTEETVTWLDKITLWFCKTFRPSMIDYEMLKPNEKCNASGIKPASSMEFARMYLKSFRIAQQYGVTPVYAASGIETIRHSICPVGRDTLILSPDGRMSACYQQEDEWQKQGMDMNLGRIDPHGSVNLDSGAIERVRGFTDHTSLCRRCLCRWHCSGGCHVMRRASLTPDAYDNFCLQTRIITACRLLLRLDCQEEVERIVNNSKVMEQIALRSSDRLSDWSD